MAFEYGEQRDANGNVTHQGSWSTKSSPKECIDAVIENFRVIKDEELSNKVDKNGNAASATKLQMARKINGVSFDGTTDITITDDTKSPATHTHNYAGSSSAGGVANSAKDSDTVDGKHATDFAPSGFGLGGEVTLVKSGSANSIVDTGFYNVTPDVTDLPKTGCYYYMIVMRHKSVNPSADTTKVTKQIAYSLQPAKDGTNIYERTQYEGVWTIWKQIATTDGNIASATKLQTARKINGVTFDGTTDITITDNTKQDYYNGDIKVDGDANKFYPVAFNCSAGTDGKQSRIRIRRHMNDDKAGKGFLDFEMVGTGGGWGGAVKNIRTSYYGGDFVADAKPAEKSHLMYVWLKGQTSYHWGGTHSIVQPLQIGDSITIQNDTLTSKTEIVLPKGLAELGVSYSPSAFAPSGFGLGGEVTLVKSGSANSIVDTGFYNVTPDVTDLPKTGCYYYMIVMRHKSVNPSADTTRCTKQVAYSLQPAKDGTNIYERTQYEGVWTAWKQIATTSNRGNLSFDVDNAYSFGDSAHRATQLFSASATINTSDRNAKKDIETTSLGLDFISKLNPVEFKYKIKENKVEQVEDGFEAIEIPAEYDDDGNMIKEATTEERAKYKEVITAIPGVRTHTGLIAQEVEEALDGRDVAIFTKDENGYGLRYEELVAPLIKAVQELTLKVNKLENKLTERAE